MYLSGQKLAVTSHLLMNVYLSYVCCDWCTYLCLHPIKSLSACLGICCEIYQGWKEGMCTRS